MVKSVKKNISWWTFIIENKNGRKELVSPGNTEKFTEEEAIEMVKKYCKERNYKFIGEY